MEKFTWRDKTTGLMTTGFNPPPDAPECSRVPFHVKYITGTGKVEEGNAISLTVDRRKHQRTIQFVESKAIRTIRDYLVISCDGVRFVTH